MSQLLLFGHCYMLPTQLLTSKGTPSPPCRQHEDGWPIGDTYFSCHHRHFASVCVMIRSKEVPCKSFSNFKKQKRPDISFFFSHLVAISSLGIGYKAAVFQACKICAFNQSIMLVLIAKCKIK